MRWVAERALRVTVGGKNNVTTVSEQRIKARIKIFFRILYDNLKKGGLKLCSYEEINELNEEKHIRNKINEKDS